jgi:hypothetical protein
MKCLYEVLEHAMLLLRFNLCPKEMLEIIYVSQCTVSFSIWNVHMILGKLLYEFVPLIMCTHMISPLNKYSAYFVVYCSQYKWNKSNLSTNYNLLEKIFLNLGKSICLWTSLIKVLIWITYVCQNIVVVTQISVTGHYGIIS